MKLVLIDDNSARLEYLKQALTGTSGVAFLGVPKAAYVAPPLNIDAVFMTLPAAERWKPDFKSRKAQVLNTSADDRTRGYPRFVVTGVNLLPEDPRDPSSQVRIVLETAIAAVMEHNQLSDDRIQTLGFWVMTLVNGVELKELTRLLHEALSSEALDSGE